MVLGRNMRLALDQCGAQTGQRRLFDRGGGMKAAPRSRRSQTESGHLAARNSNVLV